MIAGLVIGPVGQAMTETDSPHEAHPHQIRAWVEAVHARETAWIVCTYSPVVIAAVIRIWNDGPAAYARILLRADDGAATPLLEVKDAEWLEHFTVEDLYVHGEFDDVLRGVS